MNFRMNSPFLLKCNAPFLTSELEKAVCFAFGVEGTVALVAQELRLLMGKLRKGGGEIVGAEAFPHIVDGLFRGVEHVGRIETVIAQLVGDDFVGGEVFHEREGFAQSVDE